MLNLVDTNFKSTILNIFKYPKEPVSKEQKESTRTISHQIEDIKSIK